MNPNLREVTSNSSTETHIDFRGLVYGLWENKIIILLVTLIITSMAVIYSITRVPQYEANTLIQIEGKKNNNLLNLTQQFSMGAGSAQIDPVAVQIALIRSPFILEPVIKKLGLDIDINVHSRPLRNHFFSLSSDDPVKIDFLQVPPTFYDKKLTLLVLDESHYQLLNDNEVILQGKVGELNASKKNVLLKVSELHAAPKTTFNIVRHSDASLVNSLISRLHIEELGEANGGETGILKISLKDTDPVRLAKILNAITEVAQNKDAEHKSVETAKTVAFLKRQLPLVKLDLESAESKFNEYRATSGKIDIKFETQQLVLQLSSIQKQIIEASMKKSDLMQRFTLKHPFIIGIEAKLKELEKQKIIYENILKSLPAADQVAVNLMRDIKVKNTLYLVLLGKLQELQISKSGTVSDIRMLVPAISPDFPLSKKTSVVGAAGFLLGLILSCLIVLGRKAFFRRVSDPRWVEQNLNIINLAIIPYSKEQTKNMRTYKRKEKLFLDIIAEKYPRDLAIESLRSLRTTFQIMSHGAKNNIVTMMGISQSIGKSFVSVNFSCLLGDIGKRVLLIDGDIRKGYLHSYFKINQGPGLSEVAAGTAHLENAIQKTFYNNISMLPAGNYPLNPAELLMSPRFKQLITSASEQFDLVIIDTAPVLAVTDCIIIGGMAAINFLVIGSDTHQPEEITLAVKQLDNANIKIHGTIFNNLKPEASVNGNFRYNYYSAYEDEKKTAS